MSDKLMSNGVNNKMIFEKEGLTIGEIEFMIKLCKERELQPSTSDGSLCVFEQLADTMRENERLKYLLRLAQSEYAKYNMSYADDWYTEVEWELDKPCKDSGGNNGS